MQKLILTPLYILLLMGSIGSQRAFSWEGFSVRGKAKYKKGFDHLEYADPHAKPGGRLILGWHGSFDTVNPFTAKGLSPLLLDSLIFQSLGQSTLDEIFSQYPQIAKSFELSADKLSMIVTLKKQVKFSDGHEVTAEDVKFSFELFKSDHVNAFYKSYWADIEKLTIVDSHTIKFKFKNTNPELPAIATQITILPKHIYKKGNFSKDYNDIAIGTGPYKLKSYVRGASIVFEKNKNFWGLKNPFYKGRFNFDEIIIKYYKDETAMVEAFKKGEFDLYICYASKIWAKDLVGEKFTPLNLIKKEYWDHKNNQGSQGFFFNLRRALFKDARVRKAIALAFDFEWTNKKLFYDQYHKNTSFFQNSPFQATGLPNPQELKFLSQLGKQYPNEVPEETFVKSVGHLGQNKSIKDKLIEAHKLLKSAGYKLKDQVFEKNGQSLRFDFLLNSQMMARVVEPFLKNLKKIGIKGQMRIVESSVYLRELQKRNFDMVVLAIGQSQSPGNEQKDFWHSAEADKKFSRNHYGLKNKSIDAVIEKIISSKDNSELVFYTRILDRLLYHLHITVHNWHNTSHRVAYWDKYGHPKKFPTYYSPFTFIEYMWFDANKSKKLEMIQKTMNGN